MLEAELDDPDTEGKHDDHRGESGEGIAEELAVPAVNVPLGLGLGAGCRVGCDDGAIPAHDCPCLALAPVLRQEPGRLGYPPVEEQEDHADRDADQP